MAWAERRGMVVLHVSFSLLVLMQASLVTTQECEKLIVCERVTTEINCGEGLINICTAVYGRTDSTTCPHQQVSDTTCGVDVEAVLGSDCNGQSQCRITATNTLAGDPCRGIHKYLEVAYTCKDFDECAAGTHSCDDNATCQNAPGSFICVCNVGYTGNGFSCTDFDECAAGTHSCDANATCHNAPGSFFCACNIGYTGNGFSCIDIDECTSRPGTCDTNAACTNTPGSFKCACNPGYRGSGSTCTDVNECEIGTSNCYANSACTNTPGSFTCICNEGYTFNGIGCIDVNECEIGDSNCYANSACTNTPGSFTCLCNEGYTFNGTGCIVDPLATVTTMSPSPPASAGHRGAVVPVVVVLLIAVILTAVIVAVICYRRRRFSSTKDQGPHQTSKEVANPNYMIDNDQNEYAECANPMSPSNTAITTGSLEDALKHDYTELHTSVPCSNQDNVDIYNVVGEEVCKEQDEYHEYHLPEIRHDVSPQGPYQDLLREGTYQEITTGYNVKKAVVIGLNQGPDDDKIPVTPSKLNENAYQDLCQKDDKENNSYQALKIAEPEYLELIADDTSLAPKQLNENDYENL
ncbi:fibrillin-1-like isoform X3 [Strongylocentrotus purpuratus]|nr:fibrillin-1-like isoform X3 [Strongylocentrotus purpuratus]